MSEWVEVSTQADLDREVAAGNPVIVRKGFVRASGSAQIWAFGSAQVGAFGSAQVRASDLAQVQASDSAQVRAFDSAQVEASDSAQVRAFGSAHVQASGSAQVEAFDLAQVRASDLAQVRASGSARVEAFDSAQVRASGSAQVRAFDSAQVQASKYVAVTTSGTRTKVNGGVLIQVPEPHTVEEWCEFHGVEITGTKNRTAILYKALNDDFSSTYKPGFTYEPGSKPEAPDWDDGDRECGGGLHFSPTPHHALRFNDAATRFVACPVLLDDIRPPKPGDSYPDQVKARGVFRPVYEVDIRGERV